MKKSRLDTPPVKQSIAERLAAGESQNSIAQDHGVCHTTISRFSRREDVQKIIEEESLRLLELVPDAIDNVRNLVREMKNVPEENHKRQELCYKASKKVLESVGIMNTPSQSQIMVNVLKYNAPLVTPIIQEILSKHLELNRPISETVNYDALNAQDDGY